LDRITRAVAVALHNPDVRAYVYQQLHASPYPEHKLHFAPFVSQAGSPLSAGIAAAAGLTETQVSALLDSLIDLEFYMPVKTHWAQWTGGPDLMVASALRDHEIPGAYDLLGAGVTLTSAEDPPATPTLGIVPRETDFSKPPMKPNMQLCQVDCGGGGGGGSPPPPPPSGVGMTYSYIPGDYEGFLMGNPMGNPEFEVHALSRKSTSETTVTDLQCAGEHAADFPSDQPGILSTAYVYDQNDHTWTGQVLLLSKDQANAAQANDSSVIYLVWEDDNTACRIVKDGQQVSDEIAGIAALTIDAANAVIALFYFQNPVLAARSLVRGVRDLITGTQNDDFVGVMVEASKIGATYDDGSTHAIVQSTNRQLDVRGRVKLAAQP